ncbi:MAG: Mor transcription activator family protein [Clostridia bacterium]|nr:Mor transcription activator family protein [Clostridia bacterium]
MQRKVEKEYINGTYKKIADLIGIDNAKLVFKEYRGQQITFPVEIYSKQYIYAQIIEEYDGTNVKQLATKYGYSERTIRRVLKDKFKR